MPPLLDSYGLTDRRDTQIVGEFVGSFVDRTYEDRGDEELMMVPLGSTEEPADDHWEWEPARTIAHSIRRGLDHPRRAFALYYPSRVADIVHVTIGFTVENKLVLGLSVDDEGMLPENLERAKGLLDVLFAKYHCRVGIITTAEPVPLSEKAFVQAASLPLTRFCRGIDDASS